MEIFLSVHMYLASRSLWPRLRAINNPIKLQSSQCDEIFVNEEGNGCNADLTMHSASSKIVHYIMRSYIEGGLCCAFDLDELRKRMYSIWEARGGRCGHSIELFVYEMLELVLGVVVGPEVRELLDSPAA